MKPFMRRAIWFVIGLAIIGAIILAFRPQPVEVELAEATVGPMMVTVEEEGRTRIRERYIISAPLDGRLRRIELEPGDPVVANQTLIAVIDPIPPSLLDIRSQAAAEARVSAAEAALQRAEAMYERAKGMAELAQSNLDRMVEASERDAASVQELDEAATELHVAQQDLRSADFSRDVARYELELAQSALLTTKRQEDAEGDGAFEVLAPITGHVLRVVQESAQPITAGTPLVEVGDPSDLEVVVDVLSQDAARIRPGMEAMLEQWGGGPPLEGVVRVVEPAGFTKISALGVEEQRVNVIIDLVTPFEMRRTLGDEFRVEARIIVWNSDDVLKIPSGALFHQGDDWAVFVNNDGRAELREVEVGRANGLETQIRSGLEAGDEVVLHPGDRIDDGVRIEKRS